MTKHSSHHIVTAPYLAEYDIKKSHFIGAIFPCTTEREALTMLQKMAAEHPNANHLAFAWRLRQQDGFINERCHDAGEPSGTAGRPILAPLEGNAIINAVVGVIRYFGGVKLGTGGLARAYGTAAKLAIEGAEVIPWVEYTRFELLLEYSQLQLLEYHLKKCRGQILDKQFTDKVRVLIQTPLTEKETIIQLFPDY
ncbi:MAG: YigZ family protein [Gammaproteobacteria bacterium]|nr:MAG: YigZ family protein [Gammaproteobacteria bacterium]